MKLYNTVIVGAGASGILAAIYLNDSNSLLLEKNDIFGKKMLITGGGRCNVTNNASFNEYMKCYYNSGNYYRQAFTNFFNDDIIRLLEDNKCKTKIEEDNRVFPVSDDSKSVVDTLVKVLKKSNTKYQLGSKVTDISKSDNVFIIKYNGKKIKSRNVILATGSNSYPKTGSDGDGYLLAKKLGHDVPENIGGLCPIEIEEKWINKLQGITINVHLEIKADNKRIVKDHASLLFTHKGLSGHCILNNSMKIESNIRKKKKLIIYLDLADSYSYEQLDKTLQDDFKDNPKKHLKGYLHKYLPKNMTSVFLEAIAIEDKTLNQTTKQDRIVIRDNLKKLKLNIKRVCLEDAMVTNSGIKQKEIDPNTCESKIVNNLYITGELIEGCGICGGFNLQKAFSTGVLAACSINGSYLHD
jgi:predicted Rossmann fold flavoprotein